ncbi:MAG TPA: MFS transporter, partial [Ramlibacter sp.]|uniref:MFS transporter n=1 Tax=Ramlibacter sp. TaxID=1917967 RepID=UPI002D7EBEE2
LCSGAGMVVSRAVIRDMFPPEQAQKVMSQVTIYFGIAPAVAPVIGGWLFVHAGWHSIFWFLTGIGAVLWIANWRLLPETLHATQRQAFNVRNLIRGYWQLGASPRFLLLALASGIPFNGMFLYVLSAPAFLGEHLKLAPTEFFWFFLLTISGIMAGSFASGRLAGRIEPKNQIRWGFVVMVAVSCVNVTANFLFTPHPGWALIPIALFSFGWALMVPVVTLLVLDLHPERRGMASSLQAFIGSAANGFVAGAIAPLVMDSTRELALASMGMMSVGLVAWLVVKKRWPETGRLHAALPA